MYVIQIKCIWYSLTEIQFLHFHWAILLMLKRHKWSKSKFSLFHFFHFIQWLNRNFCNLTVSKLIFGIALLASADSSKIKFFFFQIQVLSIYEYKLRNNELLLKLLHQTSAQQLFQIFIVPFLIFYCFICFSSTVSHHFFFFFIRDIFFCIILVLFWFQENNSILKSFVR